MVVIDGKECERSFIAFSTVEHARRSTLGTQYAAPSTRDNSPTQAKLAIDACRGERSEVTRQYIM